jgi:phasin family protein
MKQRTHRRRRLQRGAAQEQKQEIVTMASKQPDSFSYLEFARRAFAPTVRFNELVVRNFEQAARFQHEVAGDLLEATIEQLNAAASTRDLGTLAARQAEIVNRLTDKAGKRSHALVKLATDTQAQFAGLIEDAVQAARKAA